MRAPSVVRSFTRSSAGARLPGGRLTAAVALGSVVCAMALPVLSADDPLPAAPWMLAVDGQAQALLAQRQAQAEVELLLAEAMWGEVPAHLYDRHLVRIDLGGWARLAWVDPTGRQAPTWAATPCAEPLADRASDV